jgi:hypothetical protein
MRFDWKNISWRNIQWGAQPPFIAESGDLTVTGSEMARNLPLHSSEGSYAIAGTPLSMLRDYVPVTAAESYAVNGSDSFWKRDLVPVTESSSIVVTGSPIMHQNSANDVAWNIGWEGV